MMAEEAMRSIVRLASRFYDDQSGATAIEYAVIAAGIGATLVATIYNMGDTLKTVWYDKLAATL